MDLTRKTSGTAHMGPLNREESKDEAKEEKAEEVNFIRRIKVTGKFNEGLVQLREFEGCEVANGGVFIEGLQDESMTGFLTCSLIRDSLNLPLIGDIVSPSFPFVAVIKNGEIQGGCRIFGNEVAIVVLSEYKFSPEIARDVLRSLQLFCARRSVSNILLVEATKEKLTLPPGLPPPRSEMELIQVLLCIFL